MSRRYVIFTVFALAYFLSYFYRSANAVIADDLIRDLSLDAAQLGLMTSLFFAAFASVQLPLGSALDRFGPRWVTPVLMMIGAAGSLVFAFAPSFGVLALGRALIGLGMAGVLMGALKAFSGWFSPQRFATISGLFLALGASGALGAATPLAYLNNLYGWRAVFVGAAVLVLLSALAIMIFSRNAPAVGPSGRAEAPPGLSEIFRSVNFWRIALLSFAVTGSMFAYQGLWAGPYLRDAIGLNEIQTGNLLFLMSSGVVLGYFTFGFLGDRLGIARVTLASAVLLVLLQLAFGFSDGSWSVSALALLFGLFGFFGASSVLFFAHARAIFPIEMTGRAVTAVNLFGIGGSALLQWWLGLVVGLFPQVGIGRYPPQAYSTIFFITAGLCLVALLFYLPLLRRTS
jgi:MFS family permease